MSGEQNDMEVELTRERIGIYRELRLKEINAGLCDSHNTLVVMNARLESENAELKRQLREARTKALEEAASRLDSWEAGGECYDMSAADCIRALAARDAIASPATSPGQGLGG